MLIDLTKQTFETFTVIKRVENSPNTRNSRWLCQCKLCQKEFVRYSNALRKNAKCSCNKKGQKHEWCWEGHEEISGAYWNKLKKCASERDIKFNITIKDGWEQFIKQNRKCALTGEELCFVRVYRCNQTNQSASLDRIDSSLPYTPSNIQWVHKDINRLKINFQESDFIRLCRSVVYPNFEQEIILENKDELPTFADEYVSGFQNKSKVYNIIGKRFHKLIVLERAPNLPNQRISRFLCKCDCGNEKIIHGWKLVKKQSKSCGCSRRERLDLSKTWKGHGEISGTYWKKLKRANSKRKKDIQFSITIEEAWEQFIQQNKRCAITGEQLTFISDYSRSSAQTASLDRIDSNGHYEIGNVQWVHKDINRLKNDYDQETFFSLCLKVVQFNELKINSLKFT